MPSINLNDIDPGVAYDADDVAALFGIHRTTVHKQIFPKIVTVRIGRKETATGHQLLMFARGETQENQPTAA